MLESGFLNNLRRFLLEFEFNTSFIQHIFSFERGIYIPFVMITVSVALSVIISLMFSMIPLLLADE